MKPKKVRAANRMQGNLPGEARRIDRLRCEVGNFMGLVLKKVWTESVIPLLYKTAFFISPWDKDCLDKPQDHEQERALELQFMVCFPCTALFP